MPLGQIPSSDLDLVWTLEGVIGTTNMQKVTYSYKWRNLPLFRWQDNMSVSWNPNLFELVPNTFYKVDKFSGDHVDPSTGISNGYVSGAIHSEDRSYANASISGVSWYADLKGYIGIIPYSLYGHGEFYLKTIASGSGSSNLYGHYVHPQASFGLSVVVSDYGSFSVSGSGLYDERGNATRIYY